MANPSESEHRHSSRIAPQKPIATVWLESGESESAAVLDENLGGIRVSLPVPIREGTEIVVEYNGVRASAMVRHVSSSASETQLGLEWKAEGVARKLRDIIGSTHFQAGASSSFLRMLPGGLAMLWKLHERGKWTHLSVLLERTKREAALSGFDEFTATAARLQAEIDAQIDEVTERLKEQCGRSFDNLEELDVDAAINANDSSGIRRRTQESLAQLVVQCVDMTVAATH